MRASVLEQENIRLRYEVERLRGEVGRHRVAGLHTGPNANGISEGFPSVLTGHHSTLSAAAGVLTAVSNGGGGGGGVEFGEALKLVLGGGGGTAVGKINHE